MSKKKSTKPDFNRFEHFPINIFAIVMGLGGFTLVMHKLEAAMGWDSTISGAATAFTSLIFALLLVLYVLKIFTYPNAVKKEWQHPIKLSFFPAVSISMLILSICYLTINKDVSFWLWVAGAALQLITALSVIRYWIREEHFKEPHLNPAWFIPAVGNVIVPVAGVVHGVAEINWFFFSFGMLFWLILQTIIFNRLIFHTPMPERMLPTLAILIAPPAVGFIAYTKLVGSHAIDPFGHFMYFAGILFFLLLATKINRLVKLQFGLPWWAYSFPIAALTLASYRYAELSGKAYMKTIALGLTGLLTLLIAILVLGTIKAVMGKKICQPE